MGPPRGAWTDGRILDCWHGLCRARRTLTRNLKEEDRAGDCSVQARHSTGHGDPNEEVDPAADRWGEAVPLASDDEADRPAKVCLTVGLGSLRLGAHHADSPKSEARERFGEIVDSGDKQMFDRTGTRLDRRGGEWCRPAAGDDDPVDTHRLRTSNEAAEILWVLDAVEGNEKWVLTARKGPREEVFRR